MIRSMTAFAGCEREVAGWLLAVELRTVNHRHLDLALRLPDAFRFLEPEIRSRVGARLKRGRVDCTLICKKTEAGAATIRLNRALVNELLAAAREVESMHRGNLAAFDAFAVLQWPGALHEAETDRETLAAAVLELVAEGLEQLVARRGEEGRRLAEMIAERGRRLQELADLARERLPLILDAVRARVWARIEEMVSNPDRDRFEQEMVYLAQKLDIAEELDRLSAHLAELQRALEQEEPVGRRLDFLMQELNREANTLGSKSADLDTTRIAMDMKVLIEQIREQVQNVE